MGRLPSFMGRFMPIAIEMIITISQINQTFKLNYYKTEKEEEETTMLAIRIAL